MKGRADEIQGLVEAHSDQKANIFEITAHGRVEKHHSVNAQGNVGVGIADAKHTLEVRGSMAVGSGSKPEGITLYDTVDGKPYALTITNGQIRVTPS